MKISFEVGTEEKHRVDFSYHSFSGRTTITVDGESAQLKNPWLLTTHFNTEFVKRYEFDIGRKEVHDVVIEHTRPKYFGGFFPHDFVVYLDGAVLQKHHGY
jgi:hypothetical protein